MAGSFEEIQRAKQQAEKAQLDNIPENFRQSLEVRGVPAEGPPGFKVAPGDSITIGGSVALDKLYGRTEPGGIHQILGTSAPSSSANTNLFTVLATHTCRVSVLWVANRRLIKAKVRVGFDIAGAGTNVVPDAAWLYYNVEVPAESTLVLDAATGLWLGAADDVVVRTDISGVSFGASGSEYATV